MKSPSTLNDMIPLKVSVAVLLNSFIMSSEKAEVLERKVALKARKITHTLDPLMSSLTQDYVDDADLSDKLRKLFEVNITYWSDESHELE